MYVETLRQSGHSAEQHLVSLAFDEAESCTSSSHIHSIVVESSSEGGPGFRIV